MSSNSNIRVFVQWTEQTVFSGEDIECQITFKNVSPINLSTPLPPSPVLNGNATSWGPQRKTALTQANILNKNQVITDSRTKSAGRGHRATLSLNLPTRERGTQRESVLRKSVPTEVMMKEHSRRPSISILSLGVVEGLGDGASSQLIARERTEPPRRHTRASSLQISPRRSSAHVNGSIPVSISQKATTQSSQLRAVSSPKELNKQSNISFHETPFSTGQPSDITTQNSEVPTKASNMRRDDPTSFPENFRFPAEAISQVDKPIPDFSKQEELLSQSNAAMSKKLVFPRSREASPLKEQKTSSIRVLSTASNGETPRSSGELYSLSNNSTETLASEFLAQTSRLRPHPSYNPNLTPVNQSALMETLMMGYVQICGTYTLDSSLINMPPFDDVKRKGALGGKGGGVIGLETNKKESRLLRSLGWGNLGESLGGLLGGSELSSIKEIRESASTRSIPLLLTPQSILFVDLQLGPGQSRSYKHSFKLPRGLPPSYRGKAIKITYNLIIGTQRSRATRDKQVRCIEVPFRVLGGTDERGNLLSHNLMSPYIILRDRAPTQWLDNSSPAQSRTAKPIEPTLETPLNKFLTYASNLLPQPHQPFSTDQLSPTESSRTGHPSGFGGSHSVRESVEIAILRSNLATDSHRSANRFDISRSGQRVAVVILARPAYRLGETITAAIDFTDAEIPCYALHTALETSEKVDPAIALRSSSTIHRVTRKTHFSHSESTLFSRRVVFRPTIPITCSPSFITSGVSLEWKISMEFVIPNLEDFKDGVSKKSWGLLEEIHKDDRGVVLGAAETLDCESFDISVPIRVYGAPVGNNKLDLTEGLEV